MYRSWLRGTESDEFNLLLQTYQIMSCLTSKPAKHLLEVHYIDKYGLIHESQNSPSDKDLVVKPGFPIFASFFKMLLVMWFVVAYVSFEQVEYDAFRETTKGASTWVIDRISTLILLCSYYIVHHFVYTLVLMTDPYQIISFYLM